MARIVILGAGVMGTAFSFPLVDAGQEVCMVGTHLDISWIESIRNSGKHPKLDIEVPGNIRVFDHTELGEVMNNDTDLVVFGVSSPGIDWAIDQIGPVLKETTPILLLTKGLAISEGRMQILPHRVKQRLAEFGHDDIDVGGVGGPCIAGELACRRHTSVSISFENQEVLAWVLSKITTPYYHARPTTDLVGLEACAALKNFFAIGVGYANGLLEREGSGSNGALMHNLGSGLFTQSLSELAYLAAFMGGTPSTVQGLAGVGDLFVTCLAGRNSRMGRLLGLGLPFSDAKSKYMPTDTIEGADLALTIGATIERLIGEKHLDPGALPLASSIIDAICHNRPMEIAWERFHRR